MLFLTSKYPSQLEVISSRRDLSLLSIPLKKNILSIIGRHIEYPQDNIKIIAFIKLCFTSGIPRPICEQRNVASKAYIEVIVESTSLSFARPPRWGIYSTEYLIASDFSTQIHRVAFSHVHEPNIKHTYISTTHSLSHTSKHTHTFSFFPEQVRITALLVIVIIFGMVHKFSKFFF